MPKIKSEQDAITWVARRLPIMIKPLRKSKYRLVNPFTSHNAFNLVADGLGKELWKLLNQ
jgi:hypothetical protein